MYLKLVITSLDYSSTSVDWGSRNLLSKALKDGQETSRIYATKFIGVLIRCKVPNVAQWGIEFLVSYITSYFMLTNIHGYKFQVTQLFDKSSKVIPRTALDILLEACDDKMNLEAFVASLSSRKDMSTAFSHLGIKGTCLLNNFLASSNGIHVLGTKYMKVRIHFTITISVFYHIRFIKGATRFMGYKI